MDIYKTENFVELLISDAEKMLGLYINIHDRMGIFRNANGEPLSFPRIHSCPYCQAGRSSMSTWEANCQRDCHMQSDKKSISEQEVFTKSCWKGVFDIVVPLIDGTNVPVVIYGSGFKSKIPDKTLLSEKYLLMHRKLRDIPDEETINRYTRTLWQLGQSLLNYFKSINSPETELFGRKGNISRFIQQNAHRDIKLKDLAGELCLSPSRTRHLVIELFGKSFKYLLITERMLRVRTLLITSNALLEEICSNTGFNNVYHFNVAFKKHFGIPPGQYRKLIQRKAKPSKFEQLHLEKIEKSGPYD